MFELTKNNKSSSTLEKELKIRNEMLDRHTEELFREFQISEEELSEFLKTQDNFTEKAWEVLEKARKTIETRFESELNSRSTKPKTYPPNCWISVK